MTAVRHARRWRSHAAARAWRLAPLLALLALGGCYNSAPCDVETCDGRDNDCDGRTDEGFTDRNGTYDGVENCGACGVVCDEVFPTAARTACVIDDGEARCRISACADGQRRINDSACADEAEVLCLPCDGDADCDTWSPGARCLPDDAGGQRCGRACQRRAQCPDGFVCQEQGTGIANQCVPESGTCSCSGALIGASFACLVHNREGHACAGMQRCGERGLERCAPALIESCNGEDDDCDDAIDEDFLNADGRYLSADNCGACGQLCVPSAPHMLATCVAQRGEAQCARRCEPGFVDVDGLDATGCECQLRSGPGIVIGADGDCNGQVDDTPDLIFVAPNGDDANDGEDVAHPVRTIGRGLLRGQATRRTVLVARGIYEGQVTLVDGVSLIGGYSPDFRARDTALYPVLIEAPAGASEPVLLCRDLTHTTLVDGLTVIGGDADDAGEGSTAVYLDRCTSALTLSNLTVLAGRAADGAPGADSSANLDKWDLSSLSALTGTDGAPGIDGGDASAVCVSLPAGDGGAKECPRREVSGGDGGDASCPDLTALCINGDDMPCGNAGCTDFTDGDGECDLDAAKAVAIASPAAADGQGRAPGSAGELTYAAPTNRVLCSFCDDNPSLPRGGVAGGDGDPGADGAAGVGCSGIERVDLADGVIAGGDGGDGRDGADGSGGGGATAGAGFAVIGATNAGCLDVAGGSGGGGGSGGCGAPSADGGGGGGSSVGLLIRLADDARSGPSLVEVRVVTGSGGQGGAGGIGAAGGTGGAGGLGGASHFWCARNGGRGGDGGAGGAAGGGAGGCGGGSYGVYLVGSASSRYRQAVQDGGLIERAGVAGRGGAGGFSPGKPGPAGFEGAAQDLVTVAD